MNNLKKFASILLALILVLAMAVPAFAAANTGTITVTPAENVPVSGKTLNAYKILDLTVTDGNYDYSVPDGLKTFYAGHFNLNKESPNFDAEVVEKIAALKNDASGMKEFSLKALKAAKDNSVTAKAGTAAGENIEFKDIPMGYYVIEDASTVAGVDAALSAVMLDSTSAEIVLKADKPSVEKKIITTTTTGNPEDFNYAGIGDYVQYRIKSHVPDMTHYDKYYFEFSDHMSKGLEFVNETSGDHKYEVTVGGTPLGADAFILTNTGNSTAGTDISVKIKNFINYKDQKGAEVIFTYWAKVTKDAVIGAEGNPNEVQLVYSNDPNYKGDGTTEPEEDNNVPKGETPWDKVKTFITEVEITKVDAKGTKLEGAQFEITGTALKTVLVSGFKFEQDANGTYWKLKNGSYTTDDPATEGMDQTKYESTTQKYAKVAYTEPVEVSETVHAQAFVDENGKVKFTGLNAGEYTITEVVAPDGYNKLDGTISLTITCEMPTGDPITEDENTKGKWTYKWVHNGNTLSTSNAAQIVNKQGTVLPSTGGMGTTIFYVVGSILLVGAAVVLIAKRRMNAEK